MKEPYCVHAEAEMGKHASRVTALTGLELGRCDKPSEAVA